LPVALQAKNEWKVFYIVFQKSFFNRPWQCFTWNNYEHTWVFFEKYLGEPGLMTPRGTIKVEPLSNFIEADYWNAEPEIVATEFLTQKHIIDIVRIGLPWKSKVTYTFRGFIGCVTVVKAILGLKAWWVMTPQQLRRYLIKLGGRSLKHGQRSRINL